MADTKKDVTNKIEIDKTENSNKTENKDDPISYSNLDLTRQVLQKVREYMAAEKMSMSEFARQTGVSKAWLSKLKHTDANLSLNTAQDLLHYMGYTLRLTREGSIYINKSRMRKYARLASKALVSTDTVNGQFISDGRQLQHIADGQQIAPTPGSTVQNISTPVSTVQTTVTPAPSTTQPIKLSPGQTLTVSADKSNKENLLTVSASELINNTFTNEKEKINVKTANYSGTNKETLLSNKKTTLSKEEIDLLYEALHEDNFFSTPMVKNEKR